MDVDEEVDGDMSKSVVAHAELDPPTKDDAVAVMNVAALRNLVLLETKLFEDDDILTFVEKAAMEVVSLSIKMGLKMDCGMFSNFFLITATTSIYRNDEGAIDNINE